MKINVRLARYWLWPFLLLMLAACNRAPAATPTRPPATLAPAGTPLAGLMPEGEDEPAQTPAGPPASPISGAGAVAFGYTYQQPDGNRLVAGRGTMPEAGAVDIDLTGAPAWIAGVAEESGSLWAVVLVDGRTQAFRVIGQVVEPVPVTPASLTATDLGVQPPLLRLEAGVPELVTVAGQASPLTHAVVLSDMDMVAYLTPGGELVLDDGDGLPVVLNTAALPDARLLDDGQGRLLFLSQPTDRYAHGVLGDGLEAGGVTIVESRPAPQTRTVLTVPDAQVIEGIMPLWADLTGDGRREIIVTQSSRAEGAQLHVYDEEGELVAQGPPIGLGSRWRHQLAVGPFGPQGGLELVDVLTPHLGGVVEFFRLEGEALVEVAAVPGFTSHLIGTRNLDMTVAGDFNGDGRPELVLPTQTRDALGGIQRTADGAFVAWQVPVDGLAITNLAAVHLADGGVALAVGREDGVLRLWLPQAD
ncbi:MAG: hypothetical protein R3300_16115 [Candidatus Promineifilaceae bacterium]|nr:hypothetical protein [Candidatus Promineifilaceae bacterium]